MLLPPGKQAGDRGLRPSGRDLDDDDSPSLSLWVGNLSPDTVDSELGALFGKFGVLDSVTTYAARNYAFVNFKRLDDAKMAKGALQGSIVRGNAIKIEFSRPARPGKNLWVGGICASISKEQLESEFSKFGQIEDFKFLRDRNSALISFYKIDDAISALKNMNGKHFGGEQLRVDYLRSQPPRRDWVDHHHDPRDQPTWIPPEPMGKFPRFPPPIGRRDIQSKILWIGYPPSVQVDEQMLHNAMILFGEIDQIQCFPLKHYSIVEFRSVDEARRAKEGLQGRLFNDPRIQILFSTGGDFAYAGDGRFFPAVPPPRPDFFFHGRPMGGFPRGMMMHGGLGPMDLPPPPEFFRRFSPPSGRPVPRLWEEMDGREGKRMRRMGDPMVEEVPRGVVGGGMPGDSGYGSGDHQSPIVVRRPPSGGGGGAGAAAAPEHIWRGVIAKGGTPVCSARCLPLGKGIESPFPETVNCTAKTGLDTLAKHCAEASGFDTVFFLPDSEEDFSPYTEFLQYLGHNNRAGVAKLADGATMFLVPPSSFLSDFLSLSSPNRLYGIVLNLPLPPPPPPAVSAAKPADMALTPELIATLTALIPAASAALTSAKPVAQVQSTMGFAGQREMEDEKIQRYQAIAKSAVGYAGQRETEDEKNQWYQGLLKSTVGPVGQQETEDEKNLRYQSIPKSTMAYAGQRGTVDEKNQWYQALPKSMAGSTGQREIVDDKNQRYQSMPKSTGYAGQREVQDEKSHWYQALPKSTVGPSGQQETEAEKNQMYWSMMKSTVGSDGQRETYDERNQWSTLKSTMGSSGQREIENVNNQRYLSTIGSSSQGETEDARNQWYQSMMKSTAGPGGQREAEDEKNQRYQSTMKSKAGPAGQRESEHEYNQINQSTPQSTVGSTGQRETEDEKNKRYQSTLQFAASLLLQIQKQQQSGKGGGNQ